METPVELVVDYASLWYKQFESFRITDIRKEYPIHFQESTLKQLLPLSLKNLAKAIRHKEKDMRSMRLLIQGISKTFRKFKIDSEIQERLAGCVSTDKPQNIEFTGIHGDVKKLDLRGMILELRI
jgi:hypothetical protein